MIASEKSHQNLSDYNQFLFKKRFEVDEKTAENYRNYYVAGKHIVSIISKISPKF